MNTDRKLGEVAANLDDISDTLEEIKDAVHEGGTPSEGALDEVQQDVEDASDAIDDVVDHEPGAKSESGGGKKGWS
jgi:methyl-accepting chemotaxis protein